MFFQQAIPVPVPKYPEFKECADGDDPCNWDNYVTLQKERGWQSDHGCGLGWVYDAKRNTCFIHIPVMSGSDDHITSCKVVHRNGTYSLHCKMPPNPSR